MRVLMVGLDAAGKTSILQKLVKGNTGVTKPTVGFNVDTVTYKKIKFTIIDLGGQDKIRPLWKHYYESVNAVIFVVDSNDLERLKEANEELHNMLAEEELKNSSLLVLANKQDLPDAISAETMIEKLDLESERGRKWACMPTCAITGEGLLDGLNWLKGALLNK
ncbi:e3 ubiquitin-protein ligase trim23 [Anaeramoeba flamelloides]|uniref:E3 ubiquitin-protein ligase trim23 n=1 Tax=Anaeramoeba flamelloides TaxID=1746091 RepID=A0AAV8A1W7_9EUKA|nr:e3 ubiquitin-protein ligase trim23 [Anaeramoeba flamelloides]KAJ6243709.1 e3 ubiquitin-protein ligase trim23 [Anaeramoeba flamelloides]